MKKKILIGSMLVLTLLLLMPSIQAVQQKTIEDKAFSDFIEKLEDVDLEDTDYVKYSILNALILFITDIKVDRWLRFVYISTEVVEDEVVITNPVIFVYSMWILMRLTIWDNFWTILNDNLDWNWEYP